MKSRIPLCILAAFLVLLIGASGAALAQPAGQTGAAASRSGSEWYRLGGNLEKKGDLTAALAAYDNAFEVTGKSNNWLPISATLASAHIRLHQLKTDDALKTLKRYNRDERGKMSIVWRVKIIRALGRVYAAQGREAEALAEFKEALAVENGQ